MDSKGVSTMTLLFQSARSNTVIWRIVDIFPES